jgi:proteasome lid subunit RPN8/RPN11
MNSSSISESSNASRSRQSERTSSRKGAHHFISCEEYKYGPEHRFSEALPPEDIQPFSVRVCPDASFLADLHAHICDSEIIGLLGGHFCHEEKCIYVQAAFPCKSTDRNDSGQTDVEMDPASQIDAGEAINTFGMSVVGWYHSHPTFQPDPSVTDIENQANCKLLHGLFFHQLAAYLISPVPPDQQFFAEPSGSVIPFVGLIISTYDAQNPTSSSVMRWFYVRNQFTDTYKTVYPMNLRTTDRQFRKISNPSMTASGAKIRRELERAYLSCSLTKPPKARRSSEKGNAATDGGVPDEGDLETGTTSHYVADLNELLQNQVARSKVSGLGEAAFRRNAQTRCQRGIH